MQETTPEVNTNDLICNEVLHEVRQEMPKKKNKHFTLRRKKFLAEIKNRRRDRSLDEETELKIELQYLNDRLAITEERCKFLEERNNELEKRASDEIQTYNDLVDYCEQLQRHIRVQDDEITTLEKDKSNMRKSVESLFQNELVFLIPTSECPVCLNGTKTPLKRCLRCKEKFCFNCHTASGLKCPYCRME